MGVISEAVEYESGAIAKKGISKLAILITNIGKDIIRDRKEFARQMKISVENAKRQYPDWPYVAKPGNDYSDLTVISIDELKEKGNIRKIDGPLREELMAYFEPYCKKQGIQYAIILDTDDKGNNEYTVFFQANDAAQIDYCLNKGIQDYEKDARARHTQQREASGKEEERPDPDEAQNEHEDKEIDQNRADPDAVKDNKSEQDEKEKQHDKEKPNPNQTAHKQVNRIDNPDITHNKKIINFHRHRRKTYEKTQGFLDDAKGSLINKLEGKIAIAEAKAGEASELIKNRTHEDLTR